MNDDRCRAHIPPANEAQTRAAEWGCSQRLVQAVNPKAWRCAGKTGEIAAAFQGAGLPTCLHNAAAVIYERMSDLKDANAPGLTEAIKRLLST